MVTTTRIYQFHQYGSPEVLQLDTVPLLEPDSGEVRVRVQAMSLNRAGKDSGLKTCGSNACLARVLGQNKGFCLSWLIVNKGRKTVIFCHLLRIEIYLASSSRSKVFAQQGVQ
ncbi:hypothetical protein [Microcoleus sp. MON2_D5]|uniref:hypothetical protein n=1 Tax=Microcoleus sp. MON2_D5 TaxID=2818833 RepID=UPI002FD4959F